MEKKYQLALRFYLGKKFKKVSPKSLPEELNKKGFDLNEEMTLKNILEIVYQKYIKEKK